jgi:hypothetical protein
MVHVDKPSWMERSWVLSVRSELGLSLGRYSLLGFYVITWDVDNPEFGPLLRRATMDSRNLGMPELFDKL